MGLIKNLNDCVDYIVSLQQLHSSAQFKKADQICRQVKRNYSAIKLTASDEWQGRSRKQTADRKIRHFCRSLSKELSLNHQKFRKCATRLITIFRIYIYNRQRVQGFADLLLNLLVEFSIFRGRPLLSRSGITPHMILNNNFESEVITSGAFINDAV